jgi:dGTPase
MKPAELGLAFREELEDHENKILAGYSVFSSRSRGRKYSEKEHSYRTAFQRDRDRIIHSSAFRRLEYKTQVFIYHEGDYYRTRLTHSLETAQIARTAARVLKLNEDLCEVLALAHDIGHPPFGHSGEQVMNHLLKEEGGFNHNLQGLRIVEVLEDRYPQFPGLNLTFEVREGIVKHTLLPFCVEIQEYEIEKAPTLETLVVDKSDEIAYSNHDLDDALRSRMIELGDLKEVSLWNRCCRQVKDDFTDGHIRSLIHETIKTMINAEMGDLIQTTAENLERLKIKTLEDVRNAKTSLVQFSEEMGKMHEELRLFLKEKLYRHYKVIQMNEKGKRIVHDLFNTYVDVPEQLPPHIQKRIGSSSLKRVVCDYIVGMTDHFALNEHKRLFDPDERFLTL